MFKALGALLVIYTVYAAVEGKVFAKSGVRGRTINRDESPVYFWIVVGIYAALSIALLTVF
ncbi:MAG: hypothetical protein EYC71_13455 [Gammaproteobacteria bacterium]|nr:MAG: hypothetical protein EYC71_13455 [Gammaproteobacteria bacterium]